MLLTKEEIELLPEAKRQTYLDMEKKLEGLDGLQKSDQDLKALIQGAYKDPATLKKFQEIIKETGLKVEIPDHPMTPFIKPLQEEIATLRKEKAADDKAELKKHLKEVFTEVKIDPSPENIKKIEEFMAVNTVGDFERGIRLYAQTREPDITNISMEKPFEFGQLPDEKELRERTAKELRQLKVV